MKFKDLEKIEKTLSKEGYEKRVLKKANLWSLASLIGYGLMRDKVRMEKTIEKRKREFLESIIEQASLPINEIERMVNEVKQALLSCGYHVKQVEIKALSRALIGSSEVFGQIPFEVGLCFDSIMNVPYIPGSTIKGAVRAATSDLLRAVGKAKEDAEKYCIRIFGGILNDVNSAGLMGFTDAYPVEKGDHGLLLYPDVMTPHYKDETKTKNETKTELDVSPTPIIYLTVAPGTKFRFFTFYKRKRGARELTNEDLLERPTKEQMGIVDRAILYAFIRGVGAKTALGYSRFEILKYEEVNA